MKDDQQKPDVKRGPQRANPARVNGKGLSYGTRQIVPGRPGYQTR